MEAIEELNLKRNHLKDLLNDTPFQRKDIIILQVFYNYIYKFVAFYLRILIIWISLI